MSMRSSGYSPGTPNGGGMPYGGGGPPSQQQLYNSGNYSITTAPKPRETCFRLEKDFHSFQNLDDLSRASFVIELSDRVFSSIFWILLIVLQFFGVIF